MNNFFKAAVLSLVVFTAATAPISQGLAQGNFGPGYPRGHGPHHGGPGHYAPPPPPPAPYRHRSERGGHRNDALAAGVIGLAAGAIIGSALSQPAQPKIIYQAPPPPPPAYYRPQPVYQPQPVYRGLDPWTPGWYNYCSNRYRSFNPQTGTFRNYDGRDYFCQAPR